jgi:predicted DNA-binding transcriptional regulator YafY
MSDTTARMLRLLALLQTPRAWSGTELAGRLGVEARTIRRDIDRLRALGYPVEATPGAPGYRLGGGATVPPLLLDDDEAVAIAVGLGTAAGATVTGIDEASVRALAKLDQVLPSRLRHRVATLRAAVVSIPPGSPTVDPDTLSLIAVTCERRERLRFDYLDRSGRESLRDTEPFRLVHSARHWYLVAWDVERAGWRNFRVDRLRTRIPTGPRFAPREPPASDLASYVSHGIGTRAYRYQGLFTLRAPIAVAAARIAPSVGTLEALDGSSCVLRAGSNSLDELAVYLATFGFDFTVHEPPELIAHIRTLTVRLANSVTAG